MTPATWRHAGHFIAFRDQHLFVHALGSGPPVLCLHAFPTSSYDYSRVAPLLARHFRLILFDYPGYGFSDKPRPHAYSLFEYADALEAVAVYFGVTRAYVLAHDIGDSVALIALTRKQLAVEKLVLLNGSVLSIPFDDPLMRVTQKTLLHPIAGPLLGRLGLINKRFFAATFKPLFATPLPAAELAAFWSLVTYNAGAPLYPILMGYMRERWTYQHEWLAALAVHPAPLTLIWGLSDPIATPAVAAAVRARRPDAGYLALAGTGHYPHWEQPARVAAAIQAAFE